MKRFDCKTIGSLFLALALVPAATPAVLADDDWEEAREEARERWEEAREEAHERWEEAREAREEAREEAAERFEDWYEEGRPVPPTWHRGVEGPYAVLGRRHRHRRGHVHGRGLHRGYWGPPVHRHYTSYPRFHRFGHRRGIGVHVGRHSGSVHVGPVHVHW